MIKIIGFTVFWIGIGLVVSLFFRSPVIRTLLAFSFMALGFNLFCLKK